MTSDDAREELEALIRQRFARYTRAPSVNEDLAVILAAADVYRDAPVPFRREGMHLEGVEGGQAACQYGLCPPAGRLTRNPVLVTCGKCLRSRLYRDMTAEAKAA